MNRIPFDPQTLRRRCLAHTTDLLSGRAGFGAAATPQSVIEYKDYTYINNGAKILAVAHCDTVDHKPTFSRAVIEGKRVYFTAALDDRLGVYTILDVLPSLGVQCDILLTNDEERGLSTAESFVAPEGKVYNWVFEFDRRGIGAVYYQYDHTPIAAAGKDYFKHETGTFSDISLLSLGCGGINVGTGYYNEHTYLCHMFVIDWEDQVARFMRFYHRYKDTHFPYTGAKYRRTTYYSGRGWDDDSYGYNYRPGHWDTEQKKWVYDDAEVVKEDGVPQVVKDWIAIQTTPPPTLKSWNDMRQWLDTIPPKVEDYLSRAYMKDVTGPADKVVWMNRWIKNNVKPADQQLALPAPKEDNTDILAEEWEIYKSNRELLKVNLGEAFCDRCGTANAEYLVQDPITNEFVYTCGGCDDLLWWFKNYPSKEV